MNKEVSRCEHLINSGFSVLKDARKSILKGTPDFEDAIKVLEDVIGEAEELRDELKKN